MRNFKTRQRGLNRHRIHRPHWRAGLVFRNVRLPRHGQVAVAILGLNADAATVWNLRRHRYLVLSDANCLADVSDGSGEPGGVSPMALTL